ncbi:hypothetical protein [Tamilnaduibacter salinus]|nr:hypothetical protein [Tamilnaduibacter salinus]
MSDVTGQAFLSVDRYQHPDANRETEYTRVNLGMDIELQTNVNTLELGRYERAGEDPGTSDVLIDDFGLGYIHNQEFFDNNPNVTRQRKPDGSSYSEDEIVPFTMTDPFLEFAFDENTDEVTGVRLGFGDAMGILSGDIRNLTGDVNVNIKATGEDLETAESEGDLIDNVLVGLAPLLLSNNAIRSKAKLVYGPEEANAGDLDPVRATHAGVPNGEAFTVEDVPGGTLTLINAASLLGGSSEFEIDANCFLGICGSGDISFIAQNCQVLGITACFPLTNFQSLPVGEVTEEGDERYLTGPEQGLFLSFQTRELDWLEDVSKSNPSAEDFLRATAGGYINIPNGAVEFSLYDALDGIPRYRSEYIDRGQGLF